MLHPCYRALLTETVRHKPRCFRTDITKHDKRATNLPKVEPFVWCLYDCGSHLLRFPDSHRTSGAAWRDTVESAQECAETGNGSVRWYLWDGKALQHTTMAWVRDVFPDWLRSDLTPEWRTAPLVDE